jgi:menaquinone-dependent protoporphyrinogen oxidase
VKFLQANEQALAGRPVWLFSSGPTGQGDPLELLQGWRIPEALQPIADRVQPRDIAVFHGNANVKKLNFIEKRMLKTVKAPSGDFRDWEAITAWAAGIADALKAEAG